MDSGTVGVQYDSRPGLTYAASPCNANRVCCLVMQHIVWTCVCGVLAHLHILYAHLPAALQAAHCQGRPSSSWTLSSPRPTHAP